MTTYRMLQLKNLDEMYAAALPDAILLNNVDYTQPDYAKRLSEKVFTRGGDLDFVASCDCGEITGNYYLNTTCGACRTTVQYDFSGAGGGLEHAVWIGIPDGIKGVLHPVFYLVLSDWLKYGKKGSNYIDDIVDIESNLPPDLEGVILGRGPNYFYDEFDRIMDYFLYTNKRTSRHRNVEWIAVMLSMYRHIAFTTKLPILARVLHSTTADAGSGRRYVDSSGQHVLAGVIDLARLKSAVNRSRIDTVYRVVHRVYKAYIGYIDDIARRRLGKKPSLIRRHLFGTRLHLSFRTVIIPITGEHRYDELYIPWSVAVNLLKIHLVGRLARIHGHDLGSAMERVITALYTYDPLIDNIMKEFIAESPFPGLPVLWNRNPESFH